MPRKARMDAPGALHHIIVRGIERKKIFRDDKDRDKFLGRLGGILSETKAPFGISQPAVSAAVERGRKIAAERNYALAS